MWDRDAVKKIDELIKEDPENTLCEKTHKLRWNGYWATIKCMRKPYEGIECDWWKHNLLWDTKYKYKTSLVADIGSKSRTMDRKSEQA